MKQFVIRLPALSIVLVTTLLALIIGVVLIYLMAFIEKRGRWERLALPPGDVVSLVAGDEDRVVVETDSGATYEVYCRTNDDEYYPCVQEVDTPGNVYHFNCDSEDFPSPTGQVKDRLLTCVEYEYMIRTQYVLHEDGTLWRWSIHIYPYGQLARFLKTITLSIVLGVVVGMILVASRG
jgi:hypothetical protein